MNRRLIESLSSLTFTRVFFLLGLLACALTVKLSKPKVVIVGGGFGGLYTALAAANQCPELEVTLIDKKDDFVFLPLLYDLVTGAALEDEVCPKYTNLVAKTKIKFVKGTVDSANFDQKSIVVADEGGALDEVSYDQLVLAPGSRAKLVVPGASDYAIPFYTASDAERLKVKLDVAVNSAKLSGEYIKGLCSPIA
jgi:NADH dehydrogenase